MDSRIYSSEQCSSGADVPPPLPGGERIAEHDRLRSMRSLVRGDGRVTMGKPNGDGRDGVFDVAFRHQTIATIDIRAHDQA